MAKVFISYTEKGKEVEGVFELVEQTANYVKIESDKNIITIPYHKINKVKQMKGGK